MTSQPTPLLVHARGFLLAACLCAPLLAAHAITVDGDDIKPERELLITAPAVVDSPAARYPGAWSFGTLIKELAGKERASACVRDWLQTWMEPQTVNEQTVMPRSQIEEKIIRPWQQRDGFRSGDAATWQPKLENAPFRLLAIVNRMDLCAADVAGVVENLQQTWKLRGREKDFLLLLDRSNGGSGGFAALQSFGGYGSSSGPFTSGGFGEGRLIFGAVDASGAPLAGGWTVIFEYKLTARNSPETSGGKSVSGLSAWANDWHSLGALDPNDASFAERLEQITRRFTQRQSGCPTVALGQVRTSEAAFGPDRQFRQYGWNSTALAMSPLAQTPSPNFLKPHSREQRLLGQFLHDQNEFILAGLHNLPESLPATRSARPELVQLLAGSASIPPGQPDFHWEAGRDVSREARRIFSMNTCTGCHAGETGCRDGLHVHPRAAGEESRTSDFLRPDGPLRIGDPAVHGSPVELREMEDRAAIFAAFLHPKDRQRLDALQTILRARGRRTH